MLKYLFRATYKDGRVYQQNAEDLSITEPEKRSCFFDIANDIDKLAFFSLAGEGHVYGVDLIDGHFEEDGFKKKIHTEDFLKDFRLIYYRQHKHTFETNINTGQQKETGHTMVYHIGWQCTIDGVNYKKIIEIR